jgi:type II secretory pathway pseudopilin PulG
MVSSTEFYPRIRRGRKDESKGDEAMRAVLIVVAILALAGFLAVAVVLPQMAGSEAREAAQALIAGADGTRQQIAAAAQKSGSLAGTGKDLKLPARTDPKHGELKWIIETNGAIRGWNEKNAIEISITPALQGGTVTWNCRGYPITAMPASCGGKS